MKRIWHYGFIVSILLSCGPQSKEDNRITAKYTLADYNDLAKKKDAIFIEGAVEFPLKQIRLFELAQQNSIHSKTQGMGKILKKEYTEHYGLLKDLGLKKGMNVPLELKETNKEECTELSYVIAEDFDKKLFSITIKDHRDAIKDYEEIMLRSKDQELLLLAGSTIPKLKRNLAYIRLTLGNKNNKQ